MDHRHIDSLQQQTSTEARQRADPLNESHQYIRRLGVGGQGYVDLYKSKLDGKLLVVKVMRRRQPDNNEDVHGLDGLPKEAWLLEDFPRHPNIIELLGCELKMPSPYKNRLRLPYFNGGDLEDFKSWHVQRNIPVPEAQIWHIFHGICSALAWLHTEDRPGCEDAMRPIIIHRDVKPENVLLEWNGESSLPHPVLADFGCADEIFTEDDTIGFSAGTPRWWPPEFLLSPESAPEPEEPTIYLCGTGCDVWGAGAIVHFLVHGHPPIESSHGPRNPTPICTPPGFRPIRRSSVGSTNAVWEGTYSETLNRAMMMALTPDPAERASARDILDFIDSVSRNIVGDPACIENNWNMFSSRLSRPQELNSSRGQYMVRGGAWTRCYRSLGAPEMRDTVLIDAATDRLTPLIMIARSSGLPEEFSPVGTP